MDSDRVSKSKTQLENVYRGCLDSLPAMESRLIRVFFSSTFTDMSVERNYLLTYCIPKLRQSCYLNQLEFQLVDMRWGVRDEASIDHTTTEIVVDEIKKSMKLSRGPYLVAFLGDKYGSRPVPSKIDAAEFKLLRRIAMKHGHDVSVLDDWFRRDDNAEPAIYYLLPITDILTNYNNEEEDQASLKDKDRAEWNRIDKKITRILRQAANEAFEENLITKEARQKYLRSVTESELTEAVLDPPDVRNKVICYFRSFLDMNLKDSKSGRYTDKLDTGERDHEAEELRERLKWMRIQPKLGPDEQQKYAIYWTSEGVDTQETDHQEYLEHLGNDFLNRMLKMINYSKKTEDTNYGLNKKLYLEILHHLHFVYRKCAIFCGREEFLSEVYQKLKSYHGEKPKVTFTDDTGINNDDTESNSNKDSAGSVSESVEKLGHLPNFEADMEEIRRIKEEHESLKRHLKEIDVIYNSAEVEMDMESDPNRDMKTELVRLPAMETYSHPLIIHGESGSGKTAVMAKIATCAESWFPNSVLIVRFIGTTQSSSNIRDLLLGICLQLWQVYKIQHPVNLDLDEDYQFLINYFWSLLWLIDSQSKPLVLLLDSVDQLLYNDHAYSMQWLPYKVPPNVHIVVSVLPHVHNCLNNATRIVPNTEQFMKIPPMQPQAMDDLVTMLCKANHRRVTKLQRRYLMNKSIKCGHPLFIKLITDHAQSWKSTTSPAELNIGDNIEQAISFLFDRIEKEHGEILVKRMFGYLSASRDGLSSNEMEDVLSLDDEVLQDTYLYHLPPDPYLIRVPTAVITRLERDVFDYLMPRRSGMVNVVYWYHRQFRELSAKRYLPKTEVCRMHTVLADYFLGTYHDKEKPLELYKKKKGKYLHSQRGSPSQSIKYGNVYNIRKLVELPYHLVKSQQFTKFRDLVACSFEWLYAKTKTLSVVEVLEDFHICLDAMDECGSLDSEVYTDIKYVKDIFLLGIDAIRKDSANIAIQLLARLGRDCKLSGNLCRLVKDAEKWCEESQLPLLIPRSRCMISPGGVLLTTISVDMFKGNAKHNHDADVSMIYYSQSKSQLLVIQPRTERLDHCVLAAYDMIGNCIFKEKLQQDVVAMKFVGKEKYLHLRDKKNSEEIFSGISSSPLSLPSEGKRVTVSASGKFIIYSAASKVYVCGSKRPLNVKFELDIKAIEEEEEENDSNEDENANNVEMPQPVLNNLAEFMNNTDKRDEEPTLEKIDEVKEGDGMSQETKEIIQEGQSHQLMEGDSKLEGYVIVPQDNSSKVEENITHNSEQLAGDDAEESEQQAEISAQQKENGAQEENGAQQEENSAQQKENSAQQENGAQQENSAQQEENSAQEQNGEQQKENSEQQEENIAPVENSEHQEDGGQQDEGSAQQEINDEEKEDVRVQDEESAHGEEDRAQQEVNAPQNNNDVQETETNQEGKGETNPDEVEKQKSKREKHSKKKHKKHKKSKKKPKEQPKRKPLEDNIRLLLTSPDDKFLIALNSAYLYFRVWNLKTGEFLYDVHRDEKKENFVFSDMDQYRNGEAVTLVTKDNCLIYRSFGYSSHNSLEVFDLEKGQFLTTILNGEQELAMISLHPSHRYLAVGNGVSTVVYDAKKTSNRRAVWNVWDIRSGNIVSDGSNPKMYKKDDRLRSLKLYGKHHMFTLTVVEYVICMAYCGTVENPVAMAVPYRHLIGHSGMVVQLFVKPDESMLFSASSDNTVKVWDLSKVMSDFTEKYGQMEEADLQNKMEEAYEKEQANLKDTTRLAFSRNGGEKVYASTTDGHLVVHNLTDDKVTQDNALCTEKLTHILTASKEQLLILGSFSGKIFIWDPQTSETRRVFDLGKQLCCMAEANNILIAASAGMEGTGHVWNIKTGEFIKEVKLLYSFYCVAINSTGTKFVSTMFDFPLVLNLMSEDEMTFNPNNMDTAMSSAICVGISPNDKLAFSGSVEGSIRVVSMAGGKYLYRLCQKSSVITAMFSPDSKFLVSGGYRSIYVWHMHDASLKFIVRKHDHFVLDIRFNKKGSHMISSGQDKKIVVWDFRTGISLTTFLAQAQPDYIDFGCGGDIAFYPEHIATATTLRPNSVLNRMLKGEYSENLSSVFTKAQGLALIFSSQKVRQQTAESGMCQIL